ncbi:2-oxoglutarate receptor 1-like [Hoplias malabaricus]|uniref:2-oxoglutarate receptor 1-like n=1 Tax=Hoplias malabaricus TaxID=27720 RepID=UPI0034627C82
MNSKHSSSISCWNMTEDTIDASGSCKGNMTEDTTYPSQNISIAVLLCLVLLLGLLLNLFSMWVFMRRMPKWKPGTILQFHLAISDAVICPLAPFIAVYFAQGGNWPFGSLMCRLKIVLLTVHFYGSIIFLTLISIQRYVCVVYHNQDSCWKQKYFVKRFCAGVWLAVLIKAIVCSMLLDISCVGNHTVCLSIHQAKNIEVYFIINFILLFPGFLLPFTISLYCYIRLAQSVSSLNDCHQQGRLIKSKSHRMVAICMVIFGICFLPMNVVRTVVVVVKKYFANNCGLLLHVETAYYVSWILSSANCCLDPLIYCFSSKNFTRAIHSSLRKIGARIQTPGQVQEQDSAINPPITHYDT